MWSEFNRPSEILTVTTFFSGPSGIGAFALVKASREFMPIARYMVWVGTSLFALLLVANWFLPARLPEPEHDAIDRPVIRINSI